MAGPPLHRAILKGAGHYLSNAIEEADQHGYLDDSDWKSIFTG